MVIRQEKFLKLLGFLPYSSQSWPLWKQLPRLFAAYLLVGGLAITLFVAGKIFNNTLQQTNNENIPIIVHLLEHLDYCFYPIRAFSIMLAFIIQNRRSPWCQLSSKMQRLFSQLFTEKEGQESLPRAIIRKVQTFCLLFTAITFALHLSWCCLEWSKYEGLLPIYTIHNNSGLSSCSYNYYNICLTSAEMMLLWVPAVDGSFVVSQQVLALPVITSIFLLYVLHHLQTRIEGETVMFMVGGCALQWNQLYRQVKRWTWIYTETFGLLRQFNAFFGWILFFSVGFDVLTALGIGTIIITSEETSPYFVLYNVFNAGLFLSYATLLFLPFVLLHEKSKKVDEALTQLLWKVKGHSSLDIQDLPMENECSFRYDPRRYAVNTLEGLTLLVQGNVFLVQAGGLCSFTRSFLVTIITTVLTVLLLARELLSRTRGP
ncbi:hypothetical protein BV898_15005 [Hypsibius exemplaris]|uniref:Uncharacterized protein n=1 Tax=Hypsibius exemplaris TaxID=2072580 RepID=A0A9X6N9S7_HYPEX|nr:hypothetical protein BV898_15005 [Hypsibius exemplaris]